LKRAVTKRELSNIWGCAKWALPSVVVSWLYSNAYVYVVDALLSHNAVADLAASRLLLVPISLLVIGWSSAFRPRASKLFAEGDIPQIDRFLRTSLLAAAFICTLYGIILWLMMPLLVSHVLSSKYVGLEPMVLAWLVFFFISAARNMGMSAVLSCRAGFRPLYWSGWVALLIAAPLVFVASSQGISTGVIWAMSTAECVLAWVIWIRIWPRIRLTRLSEIENYKKPVLLVDTLSSTNDFGVELARALDPLVDLTVFTIKGTRIKAVHCQKIIEAFPEFWGKRSKLQKLADEFQAIIRLSREIWRHREGSVHVQFFRSFLFELPVYLMLRPFMNNLVFTAHNALPHEQKWWHKQMYSLWYRTVDRIHVLSDYTRRLLIENMGVKPEKILVVPHGSYKNFKEEFPPADSTQTLKELEINTDNKVVLFYGLIRQYKGVDRLLHAFAGVVTPNVQLVIAGGCDDVNKEVLTTLIRDLHISSRVKFQPRYIPNQELSNLIAASDIIVFPYTHIYQSGAVLLAMTYGKAIVVSDLEGFKEYVVDNESGVICGTEDSASLASTLDQLLSDKSKQMRLGARAQELCETNFSWQSIGRNLTTLY
jgi:glycosyltransferase involved in cell wall biosynthesis